MERRDEVFANRDIEMLRQELSSVKLREESTYMGLQKAHHQIHMLESQVLEMQRKHYSESEKVTFENSEQRRRLEASDYRNVILYIDLTAERKRVSKKSDLQPPATGR